MPALCLLVVGCFDPITDNKDGGGKDAARSDAKVVLDQKVKADQKVNTDTKPWPLGKYGEVCDSTKKCEAGLDCLYLKTSAPKGYCSAKCTNSLQQCTGTPAATTAYCLFAMGSFEYCVFLCKKNTTIYSCPTHLKCGANPNPPGSGQYICEP